MSLDTSLGPGRAYLHAARKPRAVLVLGHGAGRGTDTGDLLALAHGLPDRGVSVVRVDQPWVVAGRRVAPAPPRLDQAWCELVTGLLAHRGWPGSPTHRVVVGGRSAGARVACRTAGALGAVGVLALAFPLRPPGRPERSRIEELRSAGVPALVVQGGRDSFGSAAEVRSALGTAADVTVAEVPELATADHALRVPARSGLPAERVSAAVVGHVGDWLDALPGD